MIGVNTALTVSMRTIAAVLAIVFVIGSVVSTDAQPAPAPMAAVSAPPILTQGLGKLFEVDIQMASMSFTGRLSAIWLVRLQALSADPQPGLVSKFFVAFKYQDYIIENVMTQQLSAINQSVVRFLAQGYH